MASVTQSGYVLMHRTKHGESYYGCNGLGDWTLCEGIENASIFTHVEDAEQEAKDCDIEDDIEIVAMTRTVAVVIGPAVLPEVA